MTFNKGNKLEESAVNWKPSPVKFKWCIHSTSKAIFTSQSNSDYLLHTSRRDSNLLARKDLLSVMLSTFHTFYQWQSDWLNGAKSFLSVWQLPKNSSLPCFLATHTSFWLRLLQRSKPGTFYPPTLGSDCYGMCNWVMCMLKWARNTELTAAAAATAVVKAHFLWCTRWMQIFSAKTQLVKEIRGVVSLQLGTEVCFASRSSEGNAQHFWILIYESFGTFFE